MRRMASRYAGKCKRCGKRFSAGSEIYWSRESGALCLECGSGSTETRSDATKTTSEGRTTRKRETRSQRSADGKTEIRESHNPKLPGTVTRNGRHSYFTIDWMQLRDIIREAVNEGSVSQISNPSNRQKILDCCKGDSWRGYTTNQLKRWIGSGYDSESIRGLGDFDPPLREKRRYRYCEDGDEILVDRALSGDDNYMAEWTTRENIPGVALEAEIMFAGSVNAEVVNAYNVFICRSVLTLESAGIDAEVTLKFSSDEMGSGDGLFYHSIVKVKKENEATDFRSFSAILSPAALRTFGFSTLLIHADANGRDGSWSIGRGNRGKDAINSDRWAIVWNEERRVLEFFCPYSGVGKFPEEDMQRQLREALRAMKSQQ